MTYLLIAALLLPGGINKLLNFSKFAASLATKGVPYSKLVAMLNVAVEVVGPIALIIGLWPLLTALALIALTLDHVDHLPVRSIRRGVQAAAADPLDEERRGDRGPAILRSERSGSMEPDRPASSLTVALIISPSKGAALGEACHNCSSHNPCERFARSQGIASASISRTVSASAPHGSTQVKLAASDTSPLPL
jgi:hypothetical protein